MKKFKLFFISFLVGLAIPFLANSQPIDTANYDHPIKVACVGNSITFGFGLKNREVECYPAQLAAMLGPKWEIHNYGISARTLLAKGDLPYTKEKMYVEVIDWKPDVIIVKLGTNDTKPWNWKNMADFETDYHNFLAPFKAQQSSPRIFICQAVPVAKDRWGINEDTVRNQLNPLIRKIAVNEEVSCIDLYSPFLDKRTLFPDGIHPNAEGAVIIAKEIYKALTTKIE